ncbi:MAG: single-stranded-DNA-specific exonuclease RecJ [Candidatus Vogelbacteria bacterium CG10_big_fil_rev_8_21_14_0_10_51_16]|uniref:Single-stranded-DNA-specific exonuclease RecJ n=1 Tax=Candidatus Vogelbacteria bacterium CG10_big_fil_rev_8_21_14_0_10_51_16 TaxID=1975045 RepID=A0A2H0RFC7_9BACT|nr:MAG: single-stranded-DNA-specific exonuclease RecJ [Candidatus Vogelbacteria bacterium CG10_big_fil_rev_8_21_14_0_10_51_16]
MSSNQHTQWAVRDPVPPEAEEALSFYPELQRHLLWHRGVTTHDAADRFLHPSYERDLHDPFLILNMEKAVKRILKAIKKREKIVIYGDYDCDGIPGSVALFGFFRKINYEHCNVYIPHRYKEGYGLNSLAIKQFSDDGVDLVITVDNGITDAEQVLLANELGLDIVITDHHLLPRKSNGAGEIEEFVPEAHAVINSKQKEDSYPFDLLCGAGVAFKLVQALIKKGSFDINKGWEKWLLDVVGISTIADMVPLHGENRVLAYYGLKVLQKTERPGLSHLLRRMNVKREHLNEDDVGFSIAPVINAASRLGTPMDGFHMLAAEDLGEGTAIAEMLYKLNKERKLAVVSMLADAEEMVAFSCVIFERDDTNSSPVIVVGRPEWKPGLLGLVANTLMEKYRRPVFAWGKEGSKEIKGSCRSDGSVSVVDLMATAGDVFTEKGGHERAGGFSCTDEQVASLESALNEAHKTLMSTHLDIVSPSKFVDARLELDQVTWETYGQIEALAPFGVGNEKPLFLFEKITVASSKLFGKEKNHLQLGFKRNDGTPISAIKFFCTQEIPLGQKVNLLAHLEKSVFGWKPELRLRIVEVR